MFSYYHNILKKTFGDRVKLIYTDTNSFVLELRTRDLFNNLRSISHTLDTSNFPKTGHYLSDLFNSDKSSELFYFKSEVGVDEIVAFVSIRAKVYSLISISSKNGQDFIEILNKLKGVNRASVEALGMVYNSTINLITVIFIGFYRYLLCVLLSIPTNAEFIKLSSKSHNIRMSKLPNKP